MGFALIPMLIFGAFFLVLGGVSIFLAVTAWRKHKRVELLTGTRMTTVATLRPGVAKTTGLVVALEETMRSPMQRRECVYYDFLVEEERTRTVTERHGNSTRTRTETYWATIVHDTNSVRFAVEDDTGSAEVEFEGAEVAMQSAAAAASNMWEEPPESFQRMLRKRYNTNTKGLLFNRTLRFSETVIEEGDSLIVLGEVREKTRQKRRVLAKSSETPLIVSDKTDEALVSGYQWARFGYGIGSLVPLLLMIPLGIGAFFVIGSTWNQESDHKKFMERFGEVGGKKDDRDFVRRQVDDIQGNDAGKRRQALDELGHEPHHNTDIAQFQAAKADGVRRGEVAALLRSQLGTEPNTAAAAAKALRIWGGPDDVSAMIEKLPTAAPELKHALLETLAASKDARAVQPLVANLSLDPRKYGALLEKMGQPAVEPLLAAANDPNPATQQEARRVLKALRVEDDKLVARAMTDLTGKDAGRQAAALGLLATLSPNRPDRAAVAKAIEALVAGEGETKKAAIGALCRWGSAANLDAIEALAADPEYQGPVASGLGGIADERAARILVGLLLTNHGNAAVKSLMDVGKAAGEKEVLKVMHSPSVAARTYASRILLKYQTSLEAKTKQAVSDLSGEGAPPDTLIEAMKTLKLVSPPAERAEVAATLAKLIKHENKGVGKEACGLLGAWGDKDSVPALIAALEVNFVDGAAIEALGKIKDERAVAPLVKKFGPFGSKPVTAALEAMGPAITKPLAATLTDPMLNREEVCKVLGKVGTAEAVPALKKLAEEAAKFPKDNKAKKALAAAVKAVADIEARTKK